MNSSPIIRSDDLRAENRYRLLEALRQANAGRANAGRAGVGYANASRAGAGCTNASRTSTGRAAVNKGDAGGAATSDPESLTRAELGESTDLSPAAVSTLTSELIEQGILDTRRSTTGTSSRRGRPQTDVLLQDTAAVAVTLILSNDQLVARLIDYGGAVLASTELTIESRALTEATLFAVVDRVIEAVLPDEPSGPLEHIGVSFQGVTEHASGSLVWSPILSLRNVALGDWLQSRFNVPVSVNHDCRLIARALHQLHQSELGDTFATVLFAHGVGLGLYIDGKSFAGSQTSALELGHLNFERTGALCRCGKQGCIEAYASDYGVIRMANALALDAIPEDIEYTEAMRAVVAAANAGEVGAVQALAIAGAAIGQGLGDLFTLLDPMPVALVGLDSDTLTHMQSGLGSALDRLLGGANTRKTLLHGFSESESLLYAGLALETLSAIDRQLAMRVGESPEARASAMTRATAGLS